MSLRLLLALEGGPETIEAIVPDLPITGEPRVELAEGLWPQRIEAALSVRAHEDEAGFVQDAQVPGDAGLREAQQILSPSSICPANCPLWQPRKKLT